MNSRKLLFVGCMLASIVLLVGAGPVSAGFTEDFEGYSEGSLDGQGDWAKRGGPGVGNLWVGAIPGATVNMTQGAGLVSSGYMDLPRTIPNQTFTSADTNVVFSTQIYSGDIGDVVKVSFETLDDAWGPALILGMELGKTVFGSPGSGNIFSDPAEVVANTWYELKWTVDFSVAGGEGSVQRRDLTAGTPFVDEPNGQNLALGFPGPTFNFGRVGILDFSPDGSLVDNITIIPEPGPLALVVTGLIGLLCFARRKRG